MRRRRHGPTKVLVLWSSFLAGSSQLFHRNREDMEENTTSILMGIGSESKAFQRSRTIGVNKILLDNKRQLDTNQWLDILHIEGFLQLLSSSKALVVDGISAALFSSRKLALVVDELAEHAVEAVRELLAEVEVLAIGSNLGRAINTTRTPAEKLNTDVALALEVVGPPEVRVRAVQIPATMLNTSKLHLLHAMG